MTWKLGILALTAIGISVFVAAPSRAASLDCSAPGVLSYIDHRFDQKARRYLKREIAIDDIYNVHRNRKESRDKTHRVERHYCHAKVRMSDGSRRHMWYLIERNWGFAGMWQSVEFCVSGLDPWHYYGHSCRSLR